METTIFSSKVAATLILLFLGTFALFSSPIDADFGWHMRFGMNIAEQRKVTMDNNFSFTLPNYQWANSYWLSEVIQYQLYDNFGAIGLSIALSVGFVLVVLHILSRTKYDLRNVAFPVALIFIFISSYGLTVRPLYFSTLFALTVFAIFMHFPGKIPYLPILFLFWANMHADFLLGLFIVAIFLIALLIEKKLTMVHVISGGFSFLATFVNPFGIELHKTLLKETHPFQFRYILEWRPLWENSSHAILFMVFVIAILYLLYWRRLSLAVKLTFLVFFLLSVRFSYFSRLLLLVSFFPIIDIFSYLLVDLRGLLTGYKFTFLLYSCKVLSFLLVVLLSVGFFNKVNLSSNTRAWSAAANYPYDAVRYFKANNLSGNVLNFYGWGGYLVWHLPENKVFIDGRMPSWRTKGESVFEDYVSIAIDGEEGTDLLESYISEYSIEYALFPWDSPFVETLLALGWEVSYTDSTAVVLRRT